MQGTAQDIYLIGVCGTGMGALAGMLKALGHRVRGSDVAIYPPMSTKLEEWGIEVLPGYDAANLQPRPDLVVVGNVIRGHNPEAVYARREGIPTLSMPEAVAAFGIGDKHSVVVAGTHGKTSVSAMLAHALTHQNRDPSFLVGGALVGYPESFRCGAGQCFVIEGDEYDSAYFDKRSKFIHYKPRTAIITSLEFDHADIFAGIAEVEAAFASLIAALPKDGHAIIWAGAHRARRLAAARGNDIRVTVYDDKPGPGVDLHLRHCASGPDGLRLGPVLRGLSLGEMQVPLWGQFAAQNALAVVAALTELGLSADEMRMALATYAGVRRRLEALDTVGGVTVVDDFGHHPTAIEATVAAARTRWPNRRLWALFEPRSATSRRNIFQDAFVNALALADRVVVGSHARLQEVPEERRFQPRHVADALTERSVPAQALENADDIAAYVVSEARSGDVVLVFSNGDFGAVHQKILHGLRRRTADVA